MAQMQELHLLVFFLIIIIQFRTSLWWVTFTETEILIFCYNILNLTQTYFIWLYMIMLCQTKGGAALLLTVGSSGSPLSSIDIERSALFCYKGVEMGEQTSHVISTNTSKEDQDLFFQVKMTKVPAVYSMFSNIICVWICTEWRILFTFHILFILFYI